MIKQKCMEDIKGVFIISQVHITNHISKETSIPSIILIKKGEAIRPKLTVISSFHKW